MTIAALMVWVSRNWTTDEIIASAAQSAYVGDNRHGVEQAALYYFGKPSAVLTAEEGALLAAITHHPKLDPACHPDIAKKARDRILDRMLEIETLDATAVAQARERPVLVRQSCSAAL